MKPNKFYHLLFPCLLGGMLLFPAGCSNDDYDAVIDESEEKCIPIDITLSGIQTLFGPYGEEARNVQYNKIHETRDLDKNHILETLVMAEPDTLRPPLTRATSALTNTTLRLVAYDNNGEYKGTGVYNISSSGVVTSSEKLLLTKSGNYTFHCFSPALPVKVSGNTVTVDLPAAGTTTDPAFYYAKTSAQSVTISQTGNNTTTITVPTLTPQYCKLTLEVNHSSGITLSYSDAVVTGLHTGATFTLPAGAVTSNTTTEPLTITSANPTIYVYPGTVSNFSITIHSLSVDGVDQGDVTSSTAASAMSMTAGNAYKASVSFTAPNYIKIADLPFKVARGNLLYNSSTGKWYLAPDQGYYCPKQDGGYETLTNYNTYGSSGDKVYSYINWGVQAKSPNFSLTSSGPYADVYGGTSSSYYGTKFGYNSKEATTADTDVSNYKNNNDPCYAALGGSWHLPTGGSTSSDMGYFAKASNTSTTGKYQTYTTKSNLSGSGTRTVYGHYFGTTTQPSSADQDKYVFLPAAGYRYYDSPCPIYSVGIGGFGEYWSSTPSGSYYTYTLDFSGSYVYDGTSNGSYRYYGQSVRCVSSNK